MESTSERNRRTVEELILSRIDSLVEAKLISKERLEACKQKIVGSVDASTKQSTVGILTVGLIYALLSNQRHNSNAKETDALLFNPKRTLADVLHLFEDFWKITGSKRHEVLRDLFLEVYNSRERNPTYLGLIKEVFDKILSDLAIKDEFSKIISEFDQSADYPKPKMEIDQKTTETLLAALEKVFFSFSEENPSPRVIPWEETLVERARKTHYFPERRGGGMTGVEEPDSGNPEDGTRPLPEIKSKPKKTPAIVAQELKKQPPSPDTVPRSIILDSKSGPQKEAPTVAIAIQETNPWDRVGKILVREEKEGFTGIGIIDTPLINTKGKIFLAAAIENDLEIDQIDSLFREVQNLRIEGISDTTAARRDSLRETIAEFLGVPLNLGLSPSLVREYLARRDLRFEAVFKQSVVRREYYPSEKVVTIPEHDEWLVIAEEVKGRIHLTDSLPYSPPFRSRNGKIQGAKIAVWTDELIGQAVSQFSLGNISQLLMEFDFPSEAFLGQLIPKIRGFNPQNMEKLWYLRFFVAKKLESYSVFEGEALLFWNLWRFIWTQKIPILPFDLRASFFGVLYSGAVSEDRDILKLRRGQSAKPLVKEGVLPMNVSIKRGNTTLGKIIGLRLNESSKNLEFVYAALSSEEILKKLGKETADMDKMKTRIKSALGVRDEVSSSPRAIITYLLFYAAGFSTYEDLSDYQTAENWLVTTFELKTISYTDLKQWEEDGSDIIV